MQEQREHQHTVGVVLVVLTISNSALQVRLRTGDSDAEQTALALPHGGLAPGGGVDEAAAELLETHLGDPASGVHLEQLRTYAGSASAVDVAYLAVGEDLASGGDWHRVTSGAGVRGDLVRMHDVVLRDGVERARARLEYSGLGAAFCAAEFTVSELRAVYESVWGETLDPRNFHRKVTGAADFLIPTERKTTRNGGRPARLYRRGPADLLNPPIMRPLERGSSTWLGDKGASS